MPPRKAQPLAGDAQAFRQHALALRAEGATAVRVRLPNGAEFEAEWAAPELQPERAAAQGCGFVLDPECDE